MKLYQIDEAIEQLFDNAEINPETGEFIDLDENLLKLLESQREAKIEGLIGYWKDLAGNVDKFDAEIKNLQARKKTIQNKRESLKNFLHFIHRGEKKEYGVHKISYRRSEVLVGDDCKTLPESLYEILMKPDKAEIKKAIKSGQSFEGWSIDERQNIQIK
jgi:hypothetical protein